MFVVKTLRCFCQTIIPYSCTDCVFMLLPENYFWVSENVCTIKIMSCRIYLINNMGQRLFSLRKSFCGEL